MKYVKRALIISMVVIVALQSALIIYLAHRVNTERSYAQVMAYVGAIGELQKVMATINKNGADCYERAIVIRLAMNEVLLNRYIKEHKSSVPSNLEEYAKSVADNAIPKKTRP